jgi:integrase
LRAKEIKKGEKKERKKGAKMKEKTPKFTTTNYPGIVYYQSQKSKDRTYYAKIKYGGKTDWIKIGKASEGINPLKASQLRSEMLLERRHGKTALKLKVLTVQQAVEEYLVYRKQLVSKQIYNDEINFLKRLADFFSPSSPVSEIRQKDAEALILRLRVTNILPKGRGEKVPNRTLSPQTILHHFNTFSRLFKYLIKGGHYARANPFDEDVRKLIPKSNNEIVRYFDDEQNKKYVAAVFQEYKNNKTQEFLRNVLGMYYATGFRRSEVFHLTEQDIDFGRHIVTLRDPKSGKDKHVQISNVACTIFGITSPPCLPPRGTIYMSYRSC